MKIPITFDSPDLDHVDTPPAPQTQVDLAWLEYCLITCERSKREEIKRTLQQGIIARN